MKKRSILRVITRIAFYCLAGGLLIFGLPRLFTVLYARPRVATVEAAPRSRVAIVFGAGLLRNGQPTAVLRDRVETAVQLYQDGKVEKILMSGDNRIVTYNEPAAMRTYALSLGVPDEDIVLDFAGRRTYDTCYRAKDIFGVPAEALLITQSFHLPRAVFTCNALGLKSIGVNADRRTYRRSSQFYWALREIPATLRAVLDVWVLRPQPVLGNPEPIFAGNSSPSIMP